MLGTLKSFFKKKENTKDIVPEDYHPELNSNPNFLTEPEKIRSLLKDIEEASPLCSIIIEGTEEQFSSSILDVQIENNQIILDELFPKHGNALLLTKNHLKLSSIFNGIRLAFKLSDIEAGSSRGIAYYKSAIPDKVYYPQRRSSPRIQITTFNIPFSGISSRTKVTIGGSIFDLSRGGIGISTPNNRARFQRGDLVKSCRITIDKQSITFDLSVRFIKTSKQGAGQTLIGGCFENLSSKNRNTLERFVTTLEREEIRNRKD